MSWVWTILLFAIAIIITICQQNNKNKANKHEDNIVKDNNDTNLERPIDDDTKSFNCEIVMDCHKSECHRFISTCLYFGNISKEDLYEGYTDKEIKEYGFKVYRCVNCFLPCEIIANHDNEHYEIRYNEHSNDYYLGYIPTEYNDEITDIINNKTITFGGVRFENGLFKEYDFETGKIIEGYDQYKIHLVINYK